MNVPVINFALNKLRMGYWEVQKTNGCKDTLYWCMTSPRCINVEKCVFCTRKQTYGLIERWMDRQTYRQTIFIGCEDTSKKHLGQNLNWVSISRLETKISQNTVERHSNRFQGTNFFFSVMGRLLLLPTKETWRDHEFASAIDGIPLVGGPLELGSTVFEWIEDCQNS